MAIRVGINGFGRIGRQVLRAARQQGVTDLEFVAVNDLTDTKTLAHLFLHDSVHGRYEGTVSAGADTITVDGHAVKVLAEKDPAKQGVQRILDNSTGSFKDDFVKMADDLTKVVEQSKVVSQGTVQAAAVDLDTMTDSSAVVLIASTSEVTNAAGAKQDPRSYRLIVTVARDGDQLKISKVEFVP